MSKREKVLVVDDEPDMEWLFRQRFRREIRRGEIDFAFASSGEAALDYLRAAGRPASCWCSATSTCRA